MEKLKYLNLSGAGFTDMVPHQLENLANLQYLKTLELMIYMLKIFYGCLVFLCCKT